MKLTIILNRSASASLLQSQPSLKAAVFFRGKSSSTANWIRCICRVTMVLRIEFITPALTAISCFWFSNDVFSLKELTPLQSNIVLCLKSDGKLLNDLNYFSYLVINEIGKFMP